MKLTEFNKVRNMTYLEYCDYLQRKYGIGKCNYMSPNFNKNPNITRTNEGLIAHHKMENHVIMLSTKEFAKMCPIEWQYKENIVYCDYLEHLLLHVLICKYPAPDRYMDTVGIGGVVNFIAPELNDWYSGLNPTQTWRKNCYNKVIQDKDVYLAIIDYFIEIEKDDSTFDLNWLFKSFNEQYGLWSKEQNNVIFKEIDNLIKNKGKDFINYRLVNANWINILDIPNEEITPTIVNLIFKENALYSFPYVDEGVYFLGVYDHTEIAPDDIINRVITKIPNIADDEMFKKLEYFLGSNVIFYYPVNLWTLDKASFYLTNWSASSFLSYADKIVTEDNKTYWYEFFQNLFITYPIDTIKNLDYIPSFLLNESVFKMLSTHLTQKNRPKWCSKEVWKYKQG